MIWRQLLRLFLKAVSGLLWVGAGLIVQQARRIEQLAQSLRQAPEAPVAGSDGPPAHWLEAARSPGPPQHWVDRVRQGAPHLLTAAPAERHTVPPPRGAGIGRDGKRAVQRSQERSAGKAAEPRLRMRIQVLDGDRTPPQPATPAAAQEPGGTATGEAIASREEMRGAETSVGDQGRSTAAEAPQQVPPAPRRSSVSLSAQSAPGAGGPPAPPSSSVSRSPDPQAPLSLQPEPSVSRRAVREAPEENTSAQPLSPPPAPGAAPDDAGADAVKAAHGDSAGADAHGQRRQLGAWPRADVSPPGGVPPQAGALAGNGVAAEAGAALSPTLRPLAPQARWATAPGATEDANHPASSEDAEHWPSLPSPETAPPAPEAVLRLWKHRRRLDDEQRGTAWNG